MSFNSIKVRYRNLGFLGFPNHRVGNDGSVWGRVLRGSIYGTIGPWHKLSPGIKKKGHLYVFLARRKRFMVHHLVLLAFDGPKPEWCHECRHLDGNPANNAISNLKWGTRKENSADSIRHGRNHFKAGERRKFRGEKHGMSKLTNSSVKEIRALHPIFTQTRIASMFDVSIGTINNIVLRKTWKHL